MRIRVGIEAARHTMGVGWRALRHRIGTGHAPQPRWLWWYDWEGTGIWQCRRCEHELVAL